MRMEETGNERGGPVAAPRQSAANLKRFGDSAAFPRKPLRRRIGYQVPHLERFWENCSRRREEADPLGQFRLVTSAATRFIEPL